MIEGNPLYGRSASASALHPKHLKGNPLKNSFGDPAKKDSEPSDVYSLSNTLSKDYAYGSAKKKEPQDLEYSIRSNLKGKRLSN